MALIYGLLTAAAFGIGDYMAGRISRHLSVLIVIFYAQVAGCALMIPAALFSGQTPTLTAAGWGVAGGIALGCGFIFYFYALAYGKMGVASAVTGVSSALVPAAVGILLGEEPGLFAGVGIFLVALAIILISKNTGKANESSNKDQRGIGISLAAGSSLGLFFVLLHVPPAEVSLWTVAFAMIGGLLAAGAALLVMQMKPYAAQSLFRYTMLMGTVQAAGALTYVLGVNLGLLSIVALAGAMSPLFTVLCARLFLKEKLSKLQLSGFLLALLGVALLLISSS
ncbi:EamA-like transporter family protein [Salsuginibacillus halophilus]|uniref:EamA-like transporter family protein n=1 Tax=Salsuginibacillus halophilus TaxID=517424 RepID=A0A2P8HYJ1_9BACI|nr:DMT family transporter [Salsuginibacillus halophilus]PSL51290.1 EamA-like transporter family protein [Salsuginibacillus halophilus]